MNIEPEQPNGKGPACQQPRTDRAASQKQIAYLEKLMQDCGTTAAALNRYVQQNYGKVSQGAARQ
ncbi:MAG: hypothetical protein HFF17_07065 [Oscillospiraceae bacterium]|nr:hypothetical protein [Oscillospiraceae bacterium]